MPNEHSAEEIERNQTVTNLRLSVLRPDAEDGAYEIKQTSQIFSADLPWGAVANIFRVSGGTLSLRRPVA